MYTTLIQVSELAALLSSQTANTSDPPNVAVLDCRHDLGNPAWSDAAYAEGHIPGALQAHLDRDLSSPVGPTTGRHPLPDSAKLAETLGRWGIDETVQVVAYDQNNGVYASRAWWLLKWLGHTKVAVLDGGFAAWQAAGLPVTRERASRTPRKFTPRVTPGMYVTTAEVQQALGTGRYALVDARGPDRFAGQNETLDPVAGHIPGATNRPFAKNLDAQGRFLAPDELRREWTAHLAGRAATDVVATCGSGVSACHNLLALEIADLKGAKLYAGSWSEWIRDRSRPVSTGS